MTDNIMTLIEELRKNGLHEDLEYCKKAAEYLAQQAIELEAEEVIGAKKYERTEARTNQRNGTRKRTLETRVGEIELGTLYTDGGYGALAEEQIEQVQTATGNRPGRIRGRKPSPEKLHLSEFEIKQTEEGKPTQITCPNDQKVNVQPSSQRKSFVAHFAMDQCQACPYKQACPAKPGKHDPRWHLRFTQAQANVAQRRKRNQGHLEEAHNLRAAVEATVRQIKHPFPAGTLPVRGQFRVTCLVIGSAIMSNIRRIQRYEAMKETQNNEKRTEMKGKSTQAHPFLPSFLNVVHYFLDTVAFDHRVFGF